MGKNLIFAERLALLAALVLLFALPLIAALTGDIQGTVLDPKGLVVPGAAVTVRNTGNGVSRTFTTDNAGEFSALQLDIGTYEVRVEKSGFRTILLTIDVRSGEVARQSFPLEVGSMSEVLAVEAGLESVLNTTSAQVSESLSAKQVSDLPNLSHDPVAFATLAPGTVPVTKDNPFLGAGSFNANGQRGRANNITVDNSNGTDISTTGASGTGTFSVDSVQEIEVITSNFNAEFGRNAGSQVQLITKAGTNGYHGTAYWFHQDAFFNARDFFDNTGKATPYINNLWGFQAGGPIVKDHLFVYGHYEGNKIRGASSTGVATVLTPAQAAAITDPTSKALFAAVGAPTSPSGTLSSPAPNQADQYSWSLRVDEKFRGGHEQITARYGANPVGQVSPGLTFIFPSNLPNYGARVVSKAQVFNAGWTHTFSSAAINQARFQFQRDTPIFQPFTTLPRPWAPYIEISGYDPLGVSRIFPQGRVQNTFWGSDSFSRVAGRHALKFGVDVDRYQENSFFDSNFRGRIGFPDLASFQSGSPNRFRQNVGASSSRGNRATDVFLFAQDELRVTSTLTFNYGLRLESSGGASEVQGILSNLDQTRFAPLGGGGTGPLGTLDLGGQAFHRNNNWAPRLGLAWNPSYGGWVLRGGYGWAYDFLFLNPITNLRFGAPFVIGIDLKTAAITGSNSYASLVAGTAQIQQDAKLANSGTFPSNFVNFGTLSPVQQDLKNPRSAQWNFGVERKLGRNLALKATYIGVQSKFLQVAVPINLIPQENRPAPATSLADEMARLSKFQAAFNAETGTLTGAAQNNLLDHRFNGVTQVQSVGNSIYHGLGVEVTKRYGGGLSFTGSYTYGHSIDDVSDALSVLINDSSNVQDPRDIPGNRANSQFDIRHRLVFNHQYDLPWAKSLTGAAGKALYGWSFNGIFSIQSGFPATLLSGSRLLISDTALLGGGTVRVNGDATQLRPAPSGSPAAALINANGAISQPLLGNFGTSQRNALRLANLVDFDWTFLKNTSVTEKTSVQLRCDMTNVFNHANFGVLNNTFNSPNFGTYATTATNQRKMQLALKFIF